MCLFHLEMHVNFCYTSEMKTKIRYVYAEKYRRQIKKQAWKEEKHKRRF
jgi:hypothetical protein